jgi:5'-nucleotidase
MLRNKILITNDDGVDSPGLLALAIEMEKIGDVTILAPDKNWSASGHSRALDRPLRVKEIQLPNGMGAFAADGSPADCVALGVRGFLPFKPDLVVSGINTSANLGQDVIYSGTVAAAMEAAVWGIPAIAVSQDAPAIIATPRDYSAAAFYCRQIVETRLIHHLQPRIVLNVNIPPVPMNEIKGICATRLGTRVYHDLVERHADPRGKAYYWLAGKSPDGIPSKGSDIGAVADGFVSVTPLHLDLTEYFQLREISSWDWNDRMAIQLPVKAALHPMLSEIN